jgi:hypothetical protein
MEFVPGLGLILFGLWLIALPFGLNSLVFSNGEPTPTFWEYFSGTLMGGLPLIGPGLLLVIAGVLLIRRKILRFSKGPGLKLEWADDL